MVLTKHETLNVAGRRWTSLDVAGVAGRSLGRRWTSLALLAQNVAGRRWTSLDVAEGR